MIDLAPGAGVGGEKTAPSALIVALNPLAARLGRAFLDYDRNLAARTTIAPDSLRGLTSPVVSTPVTWDEIAAAASGEALRFTPAQVADRVSAYGDLWAGLLDIGDHQPLPLRTTP